MSSNTNPVVDPVDALFDALPKKGMPVSVDNNGIFTDPNWLSCHFQGIAQWGAPPYDYWILTYDEVSSVSNGLIVIAGMTDWQVQWQIETPIPGYQHPGGMQVIGDFLAIGLEQTDGFSPSSFVVFYDLTPLAQGQPPRYLPNLTIHRNTGKAGAVGITSYEDDGESMDVMAVYDNGACDFYVFSSDYLTTGTPTVPTPTPTFSTKAGPPGGFLNNSYSNIQLLTDNTGQKWIIAFCWRHRSGWYQDWADLYTLSVGKQQVKRVKRRHFIYDGGQAGSSDGFRFTGGVYISDSNSNFSLLSSSSNSTFESFTINTWESVAAPVAAV